ncbi:MAG: hypothetical protein ACRERU_05550 [Methylococcales bacterium]
MLASAQTFGICAVVDVISSEDIGVQADHLPAGKAATSKPAGRLARSDLIRPNPLSGTSAGVLTTHGVPSGRP